MSKKEKYIFLFLIYMLTVLVGVVLYSYDALLIEKTPIDLEMFNTNLLQVSITSFAITLVLFIFNFKKMK